MQDGVAGLEAAISAYEKSLERDDDEAGMPDRALTLNKLGRTLVTLAARTGDRSHKMRAQAAFARAYDVGISENLDAHARMAEAALARLRGETFH